MIRRLVRWLSRRCLDCGHDSETHFRGDGTCLYETESQVWACTCERYVGRGR